MLNAWSPKDILRELERLHPKLIQLLLKFDPLDEQRTPEKIVPVTSGYLTKSELLKLWGECGGVLHRGVLKNIEQPYLPKFATIKAWDDKILRLLKSHQIQLANPAYYFMVMMQHPDDGRIHGYIHKRIERF